MSLETTSNVLILNMVILFPRNFILFYFIFGTVKLKNYENSYNQKFMEEGSAAFTHPWAQSCTYYLNEIPHHVGQNSLMSTELTHSTFFQTKCLASQNQPISVLKQNNCFLHLISRGTLPAKSLQKWPHCVYPPLNDCCLAVSLKKTMHNHS